MSIHIIFCTHWKSHVAVYTCSAAGALRALRRQLRSPAFASTEEGSVGSSVSESSSSGPEGRSSQFVRRSRGEGDMPCHMPIADHTHCPLKLTAALLLPPFGGHSANTPWCQRHVLCCPALPALPALPCPALQAWGGCGLM